MSDEQPGFVAFGSAGKGQGGCITDHLKNVSLVKEMVPKSDYDALLTRVREVEWPNIVAPAQYEHPDPGWQDPKVPDLRTIWRLAREVGYAVGLHGSLRRDVDLIAAPWTDEVVGDEWRLRNRR